jgi:hypothetical protein
MIILVVVIAIIVWYFLKKKSTESGYLKWPRWLKITRSCPPGFVLDEYKSCVRPYQMN